MSLASQILLGIQRVAVEFKSVRAAIAARTTCWDGAGSMPAPVQWQGAATTLADGTYSVTFPVGLFSKPPLVFAQAVSPDKTLPLTYLAASWTPSATGCGGHVLSGNVLTTLLISVGTNGLKIAGSGVVVNVLAQSVR